jgi:hypothetical protein
MKDDSVFRSKSTGIRNQMYANIYMGSDGPIAFVLGPIIIILGPSSWHAELTGCS